MKGYDEQLFHLMMKSDFSVPVFQRNYDWTQKQCKRLFDDLEKMLKNDTKNHFFGSIVSLEGERDERILIDGQQRITTVYLLFLAIANALEQTGEEKDRRMAASIRSNYIIDNPDDGGDGKPKLRLKLVKDDNDILTAVTYGMKTAHGSSVSDNYDYLRRRLSDSFFGPRDIYDACKRLVIINIKLEASDNPQLVFESLNSTGLDLSEGDKIRNFVLMDIPSHEQEVYYTQYWNRIEKNTSYDVSSFIRHYLTAADRKTPNKSAVYEEFKGYAEGKDIRKLMAKLRDYSERYSEFMHAASGIPAVDDAMRRLNLLGFDITSPYLLALFMTRSRGEVSWDEVARAVKLVESYMFRRWVCNIGSNGLNKVFMTLHDDVCRERGKAEDTTYDQMLAHILLSKSETGVTRFVRDDEFRASVESRDFFTGVKKDYKLFLFQYLENGDGPEQLDVRGAFEADPPKLTIEHVMPQTLTPIWRRDLGPLADAIHAKWLNRIANLTLTGFNPKYSNRPFVQKRDMEDGFKDSHVHMNAWIAQRQKWDEEELEARCAMMQDLFCQLWPMPTDSVVMRVDESNRFTLDEIHDLSGRKINAWSFFGDRHQEGVWKNMYTDMLSILSELDAAQFRKGAMSVASHAKTYFSESDEGSLYVKVLDNLYARHSLSVWSMASNLGEIFDAMGIDHDELIVELVSESEK
ncbi:MAG: DUF262 domain-containing protein [Olsenella uli]|uniref:DUF262 domain-containing protein n=1 Tax=Olsenella uli TaxID=133926 RepID=UPI001E077928|nr:DUF262 domain-containing protein [Olsenella uli]MBS6418838.1 DUF262 domain-containing protein [Olsenella uli]